MDRNQIIYPERKDEIGVLSKEIQNMSQGLKAQIIQLEKLIDSLEIEKSSNHLSTKAFTSLYLKSGFTKSVFNS